MNAGSVQRTVTPTSSEVLTPVSVTLHVAETSNSSSGMHQTVVTSVALCVTTVGCSSTTMNTTAEHLCVVMTSTSTTVGRPSCITVSSTAARSVSRAPSKLPSPIVRGGVTFSDYPTGNPTMNGVVDSNDGEDDAVQNSSSDVLASTLSTNRATFANVDEFHNVQRLSSNTELLPASGGAPQPLNYNRKDGIQKVSNSTSSALNFGGVKENVPPPITALTNGSDVVAPSPNHVITTERVNRSASAAVQHQTVKQQRVGWSSKCAAVTNSKAPPPVPTRTSSVLTRGATESRSIAGAIARPKSWQAKVNGHLPGKEPFRATPSPVPRSASVPPGSTINGSLSRLGAFKHDKTLPATVTSEIVEDLTQTEIN